MSAEGPRHPAPMLLVLALRWFAFAWMLVVALISGQIQKPVEAGAALLVTACWNAWLTLAAVRRMCAVLAVDLGVAIALIVVYGHVYPPNAILTTSSSFMGAYPAAAVAAWGVVRGPRGGAVAGASLALCLPFAYGTNEVGLADLTYLQVLAMVGWGLSYVLLGSAVGVAAGQLDGLRQQVARAGQRAARMAEREWLAAHIHDDVLQHLGRLRARLGSASAETELNVIAEGIARQESALRDLARSDPSPSPPGSASLRDRLAGLVERQDEVPVRLVASGSVWLPGEMVDELGAAVAELLTNVVKHAQAQRVWLTVVHDGAEVVVSVRDDGVGFDPDQETGGLGLRFSVRARVTRLSGQTRIRSRRGRGTEVELRIPAALTVGAGEG